MQALESSSRWLTKDRKRLSRISASLSPGLMLTEQAATWRACLPINETASLKAKDADACSRVRRTRRAVLSSGLRLLVSGKGARLVSSGQAPEQLRRSPRSQHRENVKPCKTA